MRKNNIIIFYVLAFLQGLVFYSSIATVYRLERGIDLAQMGMIESLFALFMIFMEIPWGMLCDRIGYRKTIIIANFCYLLSKVIFYRANGFNMFLAERFFLALAISGLSGADSSLLYLSVDKKDGQRVFGKYSMFGTLGMVVASLAYSLFFADDASATALWTVWAYLLAFGVSFLLIDVHDAKSKAKPNIMTIIKQQRKIIILLLASVLLTDSTHTITVFYNQLQYARANIDVRYFGILYMLMQLLALGSGCLGIISRYISIEKIAAIIFVTCSGICFMLMFTTHAILSVVLLMIMTLQEAIFFPILTIIENRSAIKGSRATTISCYALLMNIFNMFTSPILGKAADISLNRAYMVAGTFCLIGLLLYMLWYNQINGDHKDEGKLKEMGRS